MSVDTSSRPINPGNDNEPTNNHYTEKSDSANHQNIAVDDQERKSPRKLSRRAVIGLGVAGGLLAAGGALASAFGFKGNGAEHDPHASAKPSASTSVEASPNALSPDARLESFTVDTLPTDENARGLLLSRETNFLPGQLISDADMQQVYANNPAALDKAAASVDASLLTYSVNSIKNVPNSNLTLAAYENSTDPVLNGLFSSSVRYTKDSHSNGQGVSADMVGGVKRDDENKPTIQAFAQQKEVVMRLNLGSEKSVVGVFQDVIIPGKGHMLLPKAGYIPHDPSMPFDYLNVLHGDGGRTFTGKLGAKQDLNSYFSRYTSAEVGYQLPFADRVKALVAAGIFSKDNYVLSNQDTDTLYNRKDTAVSKKLVEATLNPWKGVLFRKVFVAGSESNSLAVAFTAYTAEDNSPNRLSDSIVSAATQSGSGNIIATAVNAKLDQASNPSVRAYGKQKLVAVLIDDELSTDGQTTKVAVFKDVAVPKYGHVFLPVQAYTPADMSAPFTEIANQVAVMQANS